MKNGIRLTIAGFAFLAGAAIATAQSPEVEAARNIRNCATTLCNSVSNQICSLSVVGRSEKTPNNTAKGVEQTQAPVSTCRQDAAFIYEDCVSTFIPQLRAHNSTTKETVKKTDNSQPK